MMPDWLESFLDEIEFFGSSGEEEEGGEDD